MGWYNNSWTRRKKLTIPAASVVGGGTLTNFPLPVLGLGSDADIKASAHGTGRDLVFTSADGTTKLAHDLIPRQQWLSRRGAVIWYTWPYAVHSASANKTWFGISQGTGATASDTAVGQYDHATGAYTRTVLLANASLDDHNNPSICRRSTDGKLVVVYTQHNDTVIRQRVSTNANDSTAWGAETTLDPFPGSPSAYSYASIMELEALNLLVMFARVGQHAWAYGYSSNSGTPSWTWVTLQDSTFDASRYKLYWRYKKTGTGRIDIAGCLDPFTYTTGAGNNGAMTVYHAYFDGSWRKTDGAVMSAGHPSSPFVKSNFTAVYNSGASDNLWIEDVDVDASGKPRISFPEYAASAPSSQHLRVASWSGSAWSSQDLGSTGTGPEPVTSTTYTGCSSFVCGNAADIYIGVQVSGKYEIQLWRESGGTYAKVDDITTGSDEHQFRPGTVYGAVAGKPQVVWMAGQYATFSTFKTGLRCYPACGSYYQNAVVKTTVSGATDTDIYVYYGNAAATPQLDPANAYDSNYLSVLRQARWIDKADPFRVYDHKGVQSLVSTADLATEPTTIETPFGEGWAFGTSKTSAQMFGMRMSGLTLASLGAVTWQALCHTTSSATDNQGIMMSDTAQNGADLYWRLKPPSSNTLAYVILTSGAVQGSSPFTNGVAPTVNASQWQSLVFDGSAKTLKGRTNTTEGSFASGFSQSAMHASATHTMYYGLNPSSANPFVGYMTEFRISNVARTKAWTDTESAAMSTGIVTFGAEETNAAAFTFSSSGGLQFGGAAGATSSAVFVVSGVGGVTFAGAATYTSTYDYAFSAGGGLQLGGSSTFSLTNNFSATSSGGMQFGGAADTQVDAGFSATGEGGIAIGGAATVVEANDYEAIPSGGFTLGGDATLAYTSDFAMTAGGGMTFAGAATATMTSAGSGAGPSADEIADAVWQRLINGIPASVLVDELHRLHGLRAGVPLSVTATQRTAGGIEQTVADSGGTVVVERI